MRHCWIMLQHVEQGWPNERNFVQRGGHCICLACLTLSSPSSLPTGRQELPHRSPLHGARWLFSKAPGSAHQAFHAVVRKARGTAAPELHKVHSTVNDGAQLPLTGSRVFRLSPRWGVPLCFCRYSASERLWRVVHSMHASMEEASGWCSLMQSNLWASLLVVVDIGKIVGRTYRLEMAFE